MWARPVLNVGPGRDALTVDVSLKEVSVWRRQEEVNSLLLTSTPRHDHQWTQHREGSWTLDDLSSVKDHLPSSDVPCQHMAGVC